MHVGKQNKGEHIEKRRRWMNSDTKHMNELKRKKTIKLINILKIKQEENIKTRG